MHREMPGPQNDFCLLKLKKVFAAASSTVYASRSSFTNFVRVVVIGIQYDHPPDMLASTTGTPS